MVEQLSPPPRPEPRTPSIRAPTRITSSDPVGTEEDSTAGWAILESFPTTQMSVVDVCDSPQLVRARMSTGTGSAPAALDMSDRMTKQESVCFLCSCPIIFLHRSLVHFAHDECLRTIIM